MATVQQRWAASLSATVGEQPIVVLRDHFKDVFSSDVKKEQQQLESNPCLHASGPACFTSATNDLMSDLLIFVYYEVHKVTAFPH
jgi:hypothetical protein